MSGKNDKNNVCSNKYFVKIIGVLTLKYKKNIVEDSSPLMIHKKFYLCI